MTIRRLTTIDLQKEAVANGKSRQLRTSLAARAVICTRDARAHDQLAGLHEGECIHLASMGELSLHDVAAALVAHYGPFECLTLSTWAAAPEAIQRLIGLRAAGHVGRLEALVDSRAPIDCPDAHALLKLSFNAYGVGQNHSKVIALTGGRDLCEAGGIAVVSTANLTRNPRCEVMVVSMHSGLAEFHRDWIREVLKNA